MGAPVTQEWQVGIIGGILGVWWFRTGGSMWTFAIVCFVLAPVLVRLLPPGPD